MALDFDVNEICAFEISREFSASKRKRGVTQWQQKSMEFTAIFEEAANTWSNSIKDIFLIVYLF